MNLEQTIVSVPQLYHDGLHRDIVDVVFSNRRILVFKTAQHVDTGTSLLEALAPLIAGFRSRALSNRVKVLSLPELLECGLSYQAYEYSELKSIVAKRRQHLISFRSHLEIRPNHGKAVRLWGKPAEMVPLLEARALVQAAGAPLIVKGE